VETYEASSGQEANDPLAEMKVNNSVVFLMMGMPYFLLGALGILIYRGIKKKDRADH
jgi:hypothetical protein